MMPIVTNPKSKVVLLGGTYGSGKSTTAELIHTSPHNKYKTAIVDYDILIGNGIGVAVDVAHSDAARKEAWHHLFLPAIQEKIREGYELVLVPGTFSTRERRERFITHLQDMVE